jgi:hypothetical protein
MESNYSPMPPKLKKFIQTVLPFVFLFATLLPFAHPMLQGLILLPLDLLVSNYQPWGYSGQILLKNPYMQDSIAQMYPWKQLVFDSFRRGIIPFWNPYQFTGIPFMASMKPMVFYPLSVFGLLGDVTGWNLLLLSQIALSLLFTYLFTRSLSIGKLGSIMSAVTFSFCSLMACVLEFGSEGHAILWMPMILFGIVKYFNNKNSWFLLIVSLSVTMSILAGQLQYTTYILLFSIAFAFYLFRQSKITIQHLVYIFTAIGLGISMSAIQLGPGITMFLASSRGVGGTDNFFIRGLIPVYKLFRFFSPDFFGNPVTHDLTIGYIESSGYIGIVSLILIVHALLSKKRNTLVTFFSFAALTSVALCLKGIGNSIQILHIPIISSGSGDRIIVIALFCGSILSGFGIDQLQKKLETTVLFKSFLIIGGLFFGSVLFSYIFQPHLDIASRHSLLSGIKFPTIILTIAFALFLIWIYIKRFIKHNLTFFLLLSLIGLTYLDLFRMSYRFLTYSNPKFLYPETPVVAYVKKLTANTLGRTLGTGGMEIPTALRIYSPETYNPLFPSRQATFISTLLGEDESTLPATNKIIFPYGNGILKNAMDITGVKYIIVPKDTNASIALFDTELFSNSLTRVYTDDRYEIFENNDAVPRFGLRYDVVHVLNNSQALAMILQHNINVLKTVIITSDSSTIAATGTGSASLISYGLNTAEFRTDTSSPALFYLSDNYDPGWHATVNGKNTPIYKANYNFRAIPVPAGSSHVSMWYEPVRFRLYLAISTGSFCLLMGIILTNSLQISMKNKRSHRG